ncbi:hypothetical protein Cs7R123_33260 [Catellatospora sp. TT07R-123]|uniref:hypothetical protein n=1 Tax=Catellatospora sp. TT07R-123 TaxID=2733863 RepID=UPI001B1B44D3|nr:hypothetical protein [Catellatospora sp. TT07R-123]GHJ45984.1 hypothetical protein Cs7R123_33260 [Catellatospora sp. TT07R-123]
MKQLTERLRAVGRITGGPLLVRAVVFAAAFAGLLIAAPAGTLESRLVVGLLVAAVLPALAPRGIAVTGVLLVMIGLWLVDTMAFGSPVTLARLLGLAVALYLTHAAAALAAVLPYDAIVDNQVIIRWAARAVLLVTVSGGLTIALAELLPGHRIAAPNVALVVGLAATALTVGLLTQLGRRP